MSEESSGCLNGLRVLDLTDESGHLTGRILADLGAEVIKVEPPGGDASRQKGPFVGGVPDPDCGAQWLARNAGKQTTIIDLNNAAGFERLRALVRDADVLIESFAPGALAAKGLAYADLSKLNPALVVCSITPYGQTGPYAPYRGSDLTTLAASGNLFMTGDPARAPVRCSMPVTHYHGGAEAAVAILSALWERDRSGKGQHVDVSLQETMLMPNMSHPAQAWVEKYKGKRSGAHNRVGETIQREIWPCKDGYVSFALRGGPARIPGLIAFVQYMDEHGMAPALLKERDWKKYNHNTTTQAEVDAMVAPIGAFFLTKTMQELYDVACERRLMLAPASTEREVLNSRQLKSRNFIVEQGGPKDSRLPYPERFAQWSRTRIRGSAPSLRTPVSGFSTNGFSPAKRGRIKEGAGIFAGLKIVEFGAGAAAPLATRYFADQGATVVKIESRQRPDFLRILRDDGSGKLDASLFFACLNPNKLSAGLNMRDPRAIEMAHRLIQWGDVLIENFAPGVMQKWGLDYASLQPRYPGLVMVSTCLWGQTGPERAYPGFGGQGSALAGFNYLTGWPDQEPLGPFGTITDSMSPRYVASSIIAALLHRNRTGEGSFIDLSQVEAGVYCLTEWLLGYAASGETFGRIGNRSAVSAPHGVFPAAGEEDRWIALAIHTDDDWTRLVDTMGKPTWAGSAELRTTAGRLRQVDMIEREIAAWTAPHKAEDLVARLRAAGLDAAVVEHMQDLLQDPQLAHRGHFQQLTHPVLGAHVIEANGIRFSASPHQFTRSAPCLTADSEAVYCDLLGMPRAEVAALIADGVLS